MQAIGVSQKDLPASSSNILPTGDEVNFFPDGVPMDGVPTATNAVRKVTLGEASEFNGLLSFDAKWGGSIIALALVE